MNMTLCGIGHDTLRPILRSDMALGITPSLHEESVIQYVYQ